MNFIKHLHTSLFRAIMCRKCSRGSVTVEYALSMAIAAIIMLGVVELFRALSVEIILYFLDYVPESYP